MTTDTLLLFAATPGPTTTAVVARVLVDGPRQAPAFGLGILLGDVLLLLASIGCLIALAATVEPLLRVIQYAGAAYLLHLAWRLATASAPAPGAPPVGRGSACASGVALALGNPKAMLFYLALLPAVIGVADLQGREIAVLLAVMVPVFVVVYGAYVYLATRLRTLIASPRAAVRVQRASAVLMAAAALVIALR